MRASTPINPTAGRLLAVCGNVRPDVPTGVCGGFGSTPVGACAGGVVGCAAGCAGIGRCSGAVVVGVVGAVVVGVVGGVVGAVVVVGVVGAVVVAAGAVVVA